MPKLDEAMPKYRQIAEHFRDQILRGDLGPGAEIPSERVIALQFSVARPTATKALEILRRDGLVESVQGSGTFVLDQRPNRLANERYRRSSEQGKVYAPGEYARIVLSEVVHPAPARVADALQLAPSGAAIRRKRIIFNESGPIEVSVSWFDVELSASAERLLSTDKIREGTLAYVQSTTGRRAIYARDRISARASSTEETSDLGLEREGAPVLAIEHLAFDEDDKPLEFAEAVYPAGRWAYQQEYSID